MNLIYAKTISINWIGKKGFILHKIKSNPSDYYNAWNNNKHYWRSQMTEEEVSMRSHPNRSPGWIPNRIQKKITELQLETLALVTDKFKYSPYASPQDCLDCGLQASVQKSALDDYNQLLKNITDSPQMKNEVVSYSEKQQIYSQGQKDVITSLEAIYPPEVIVQLPTHLPLYTTQTQIPRKFGLCAICSDKYTRQADQLITNIING